MRKKERKAYDEAIAQYGAELKKLKPIEGRQRLERNLKRSLESQEDNLSGRAKSLLKQADRAGRDGNEDKVYFENVSKFNDRYNILKKQLAGGSDKRFYVDDTPTITASPKTSAGYSIGSQNNSGFGQGTQSKGLANVVGVQLPNTNELSYNPNKTYYKTREEALAAAEKAKESYNPPVVQKQNNFMGAGLINSQPAPTPEVKAADFVKQQDFGNAFSGPSDSRKTRFNNMQSAGEDIEALTNAIKGTSGYEARTRYAAIAEKLNPLLKRQLNNSQPSTGGLLANELVSGRPVSEVIQ